MQMILMMSFNAHSMLESKRSTVRIHFLRPMFTHIHIATIPTRPHVSSISPSHFLQIIITGCSLSDSKKALNLASLLQLTLFDHVFT